MQIKDIATLRAEIEALKARQKAVEDLQTDRNMPVHLLNELVKQTPEGVYLTAIKQNGQVVPVNGMAQTNERVSEFLRNTAYNSPWLEQPELVEIKAVTRDRRQPRAAAAVRVLDARDAQAAAGRAPLPPAPPRAPRRGRRRRRARPPEGAMAKASTLNFDVNTLFEQAASQFRGLNPNEPGQWPLLPKAAAWLAAGRGRGRGRLVRRCCPAPPTSSRPSAPAGARAQGTTTATKLAQAVNLGELRKQKLQVQEYVTQLEKQLPGKAEMDALLSDINQAGLGRGLQFELFRPGQVRGQGLLRRAADRHHASPAATTTSARSPPTWPTCRASSRCTT